MNKQELIDEIEKNKNEYYKLSTDMKSAGISRGIGTGIYMGLLISQKNIERLDEQPETTVTKKVKVPKAVAEWFEAHKDDLDYSIYEAVRHFTNQADYQEYSNVFKEWFSISENNAIETLVKMKVIGYEIANPEFIIKIGHCYLIEPLGDTSDYTIRITWNYDRAYKFSSYDMAQTHANKFGGIVEEVK